MAFLMCWTKQSSRLTAEFPNLGTTDFRARPFFAVGPAGAL